MTDADTISPDFPFESRYVEVLGSKLYYIDEGGGDPVLFLHGNPTSSYLWRNIIPHLIPAARCIVPDLIGMGKSDKPDISYRFFDHYRYIEGFIKTLELKNITLVLHDWGSALGFHYAMMNEDNIKGIVFMEAIIKPLRWKDFPGGYRLPFKMMRMPVIGWFFISVMNIFLETILPSSVIRKLSDEEMNNYREPFPDIKSRRPVRQWPREIPVEGKPADVHNAVSGYLEKLMVSDVPKLFFYAIPGAIIPLPLAKWLENNIPNIKSVDLGEGLHYLQEDHPHRIGEEIARWYEGL